FEQFENEKVQLAIVDLDIVKEFIKSDYKTNINETILNTGDAFEKWEKVDSIINTYTKQNRFVAIKYCKELDFINYAI
ncbi:25824_t:CDS:2, partial [Gigaspora margarita]